jgi:hypothetical protein
MNAQAYVGYFENGNFYTEGRTVKIPERKEVVITILDEPMSLKDALWDAQEQAKINGTSEMTLDEINEIIAECRRELREETA